MAVAVQPSAETKKPAQPMGLIAASPVGAVYVLVAAAVVLRLIPWLWDDGVGRAITGATNEFVPHRPTAWPSWRPPSGSSGSAARLASGPQARAAPRRDASHGRRRL